MSQVDVGIVPAPESDVPTVSTGLDRPPRPRSRHGARRGSG